MPERLYQSDFSVIDESEDWIVINKPPHLLVHPSKPGNPPTLLDELEQLLCFEIANGGQISILNRIDRETSGIVVAVKHREAAVRLRQAMEAGEFSKTYLAIVHDWPEDEAFEVNEPIARKGITEPSEIYIRQWVHPSGRPARTGFRVLDRFEKTGGNHFSLLECQLFTGRTHQIRVHLEFSGFPIVGDKIYGHSGEPYLEFIKTGWTEKLEKRLLLNRHALHASRLAWRDHDWRAELPPDLMGFLSPSEAPNSQK